MIGDVQRLYKRFSDLRKQQSDPVELTQKASDKLFVYSSYPFVKRSVQGRCFTFHGRQIPYYIHHCNATWRNERAVEIALALDFLERNPVDNWLELGGVMPYYLDDSHVVIDKYEEAKGTNIRGIL